VAGALRAPADTIPAPPFPAGLGWVNVATLRMDKQLGRPVLVEFWDFCRVNSLRTLPYIREWHRRYADDGLRVIGVHSPGFPPSQDDEAVREAVPRLEIEYAVALDGDFEVWKLYGNRGWPARYLWDARGMLVHYHYGDGAYEETERAIQSELGVEAEPLAPVRPEDEPGARLMAPSPDRPGAYSGPYEAGGVWAVLEGAGAMSVNGAQLEVAHTGCHQLIAHDRHTAGVLDLRVGDGVTCHAVCFTAGIAP
jgi:thiol-disulfide isomerase/thioredoxin